jgi:branched-chain amino acid transport system permease protein
MVRGVNIRRYSLYAFAAAGLFGGLLGPLIAATGGASATTPLSLAVKAFIALTIGGVGSQAGALIGGIFVGLVSANVDYWFGVAYGDVVIFVIFLAVMLVRPQGMLGQRRIRVV